MTVGWLLRQIRKGLKLSQEAFGGLIGISQVHVSRMEQDEARPSNEVLASIYRHTGNSMALVMIGGIALIEAMERMMPIGRNAKFA